MQINMMRCRNAFFGLFIAGFLLLSGCATSSNIAQNDYVGVYQSEKNALNRFIIDYDDGLYRIQYNDPDEEWEGVGYERGSKIVAVLRHIEEEDDAEFLNISFPGDDQLFVVARNLEGEYIRDEYFERVN